MYIQEVSGTGLCLAIIEKSTSLCDYYIWHCSWKLAMFTILKCM